MKALLLITVLFFSFYPLSSAAWHKDDHPLNKAQELRKSEFDVIDSDQDGLLQPAETEAELIRKFDALDLDKDGVISSEEQDEALTKFGDDNSEDYGVFLKKWVKKLNINFKKADSNHNGKITQKEHDAFFSGRYKGMDRNRDGLINIFEFRKDSENAPVRK